MESAYVAEQLLGAMDLAGYASAILMGSSKFTITLRPEDGFTHFHGNNRDLLKARRLHPDRFEVWPTLDPLEPDNCRLLESYISEGATGLKLYVGHAFNHGTPPRYLFHTTPIDSDQLHPVYEFCEKHQVPICLHVNTTDNAPGFREEFERVLMSYPALRVLAPHWMLASGRLAYLQGVLERFPNVWTDVSFGQDSFLEAGLRRISKAAEIVSNLVRVFPTRLLCGSDIVCTAAQYKTKYWMADRMLAYRYMLEEEVYACPITGERRYGLGLTDDVLTCVLRANAEHLLHRYDVRFRLA